LNNCPTVVIPTLPTVPSYSIYQRNANLKMLHLGYSGCILTSEKLTRPN